MRRTRLVCENLEDRTVPSSYLGTAEDFAVLAASTVTNTGPSVINGDLGLWPGTSVTGFPPGLVNGTMHVTDAVANLAQNDLVTAYNSLAGLPAAVDLTGQDLGGMTLTPGVYNFDTSAFLTGALTLNFLGNSDSLFVFQMGSTLITASNSSIVAINPGDATIPGCEVYWQVGSSATLGTGTDFLGNIVALTSITLNTGADIIGGRALARNAAVTLDTNVITLPDCETEGEIPVSPVITDVSLDECIDRYGTVALSGTFADVGGGPHTVVIQWGVGQGSTTLNLAAGVTTFAASHAYVPGSTTPFPIYNITTTVTDQDNLSDSETVTVAVVAGAGAYTLKLSSGGTDLQIYRGSTLLVDEPVGVVDLVVVVGKDNVSDSLTVSGINGNPIPRFGVGYSGRTAAYDKLIINNFAYDVVTYNYENQKDGTIVLTQGANAWEICFKELEKIDTTASSVWSYFNLPECDGSSTLEKYGASLELSGGFVETYFKQPSDCLEIDGQGGNDLLYVYSDTNWNFPPNVEFDVDEVLLYMYENTLTVGTVDVAGALYIYNAAAINGGSINVHGLVKTKDTSIAGTAKISLVGTGNQTLDGPGQLPNLDISKPSGTVKVLGDTGIRGNITGTGGVFAYTGNYLVLQNGNSTIDFPGKLWHLALRKTAGSKVTLLSDLTVQGVLSLDTGIFHLASKKLSVGSNVLANAGSELSFDVNVASPPATPRLNVAGILAFYSGHKFRINSAGASVNGNYKLVQTGGGVRDFHKATKIFNNAHISSVYADSNSIWMDLV